MGIQAKEERRKKLEKLRSEHNHSVAAVAEAVRRTGHHASGMFCFGKK